MRVPQEAPTQRPRSRHSALRLDTLDHAAAAASSTTRPRPLPRLLDAMRHGGGIPNTKTGGMLIMT